MFCTLLIVDIWGVKIVDDVLLIGATKADETAAPPISRTIDNPLFMMNLFFILYYQAAAARVMREEEECQHRQKTYSKDMRYPCKKILCR